MPITYTGMNDRWIQAFTAIMPILLLILVIWALASILGRCRTRYNLVCASSTAAKEIMSWGRRG